MKNLKYLLLALVLATTIFSCKEDPENLKTDLVGKWKMTEVLMDPGDGSGTFHPVNSNKILEFKADGIITSNGSLCTVSAESNFPDSGTWSLTDSTITSQQCYDSLPLKIRFIQEGSTLTISYPCFEACKAKFSKM